MYLVSPVIWMLPPLVHRIINPDLQDTEQAYIYACQSVLPAGMVGLMVAAMASATASMATTRLNVFAGAFTSEVYQRKFNRDASEQQLVRAGRIITVILGLIVIAGSLLIPLYGYTSFIVDMNKLLYGPMLMPTIWGLFSRKIGLRSVWITMMIGFAVAWLVKFGLAPDGVLTKIELLSPLVEWVSSWRKVIENTVGIAVPFLVLLVFELSSRETHPGWQRVADWTQGIKNEQSVVEPSKLPGIMVGICLVLLSVLMGSLSFFNHSDMISLFGVAAILFVIGAAVFFFNRKQK
jgi:Na+/proline symporter